MTTSKDYNDVHCVPFKLFIELQNDEMEKSL